MDMRATPQAASILARFSQLIWLTLLAIATVVVMFVVYVRAEKRIDFANDARQRSFELAGELSDSSDDLMRMARTYVATGNPVYRRHYQEILDIRDGRKPRPADYRDVEWRLGLSDVRGGPMEPAVPLLELMRRAGMTPDELALLTLAKARSDELAGTELAAMALVDAGSPGEQARRGKALEMLHDAAYHRAKAGIMQPIVELRRKVDLRTLLAVHEAEAYATTTRIALVACGLFAMLTLWGTRHALLAVLGGPLDDVFASIARLGLGEFTSPVRVAPGARGSVLDWVGRTQQNLATLDAERSQAEAAAREAERRLLTAANADLEQQVAQRTAELQAALDAARQASQAKSTFLSSISHELRTPMNAILGFSQLLLMRGLPPEQQLQVEEIHQAGRHLLSLIDDLLDLTRIEAGLVTVTRETVPLAHLVDEASSLVKPLFEARRLVLANHLPAGACMVADPVRLRQVVVNLLSNAAKYNREGGSVTVDLAPAEGGRLRLAVSDTGEGIAPEQLPRLFRTFERLGAVTRGIEGTGIGLALCRQLMELMGGTIGVASQVGEGSTFWIELPAAQAPAADRAGSEGGPPVRGAGEAFEVLYIEDNRANLKVVEDLFGMRPRWRLLQATNGTDGLALARSARPDAILLDIHLPGMDGFEVMRALQADPATAGIPVLALSADVMPGRVQAGLAAGFRAYLAKPLDLNRLVALLDEMAAPR